MSPWHSALAFALTNVELPLPPSQSPDPAGLVNALADEGWSAERIGDHARRNVGCRAAVAASDPCCPARGMRPSTAAGRPWARADLARSGDGGEASPGGAASAECGRAALDRRCAPSLGTMSLSGAYSAAWALRRSRISASSSSEVAAAGALGCSFFRRSRISCDGFTIAK